MKHHLTETHAHNFEIHNIVLSSQSSSSTQYCDKYLPVIKLHTVKLLSYCEYSYPDCTCLHTIYIHRSLNYILQVAAVSQPAQPWLCRSENLSFISKVDTNLPDDTYALFSVTESFNNISSGDSLGKYVSNKSVKIHVSVGLLGLNASATAGVTSRG